MFQIQCKVAALNAGLDTTLFRSPDFADFVQGHFRAASGGDIELDVQFDSSKAPLLAAGETAVDGDLHFAMRSLTQNPSRPPLSAMGLLVGFQHRSDREMFGLMFDQGIASAPGDLDAAVAREGAAIFLNPITNNRSSAEHDAECRFTAIHELGHAFNLTHSPQDPPSFMSRSAVNSTAFGAEAYFFEVEQQDPLSRCSTDLSVRHDGSPFSGGPSSNTGFLLGAPCTHRIRLVVEARPEVCTRYEPIHLDVTLRVPNRAAPAAQVPRMIDPAHERFRIFITDPSGRERRYRNSTHCCPSRRRLKVSSSSPFQRDIVLLTEQGRYTFGAPGVHRIRVEFDVSPRVTLQSSTEIMILAERDRGWERSVNVLVTLGTTRLLQFRRAPNAQSLNRLYDLICSRRGRWDERKCLIAYRWAFAVLEARRGAQSADRAAAAVRFLEKCRYLRPHREARSAKMIEQATGAG